MSQRPDYFCNYPAPKGQRRPCVMKQSKLKKFLYKDTYTLSNGVKIPCIGFGTWQTPDDQTAVAAVHAAVNAGYRHIDTAKIYHNEVHVGEALKDSLAGFF